MKIKQLQDPPTDITFYESWDGPGADDLEDKLTPKHVEDVVEREPRG